MLYESESVPVCGDPDTAGQKSGIGICGFLCVASCKPNTTAHLPSRRTGVLD